MIPGSQIIDHFFNKLKFQSIGRLRLFCDSYCDLMSLTEHGMTILVLLNNVFLQGERPQVIDQKLKQMALT